MEKEIRLLGISGSLRKASFNRGLLRAVAELMPEGMTLEIADISQIPLYNEDEYAISVPEAVRRLKEQILIADGIVIATPEYNHSVPGVLKNAIDWASRPIKSQPFAGKPLAVLGAGGRSGTIRAQAHLRQIAAAVGMQQLPEPEVAVQRAWEKFDADGNLVDEDTRQLIQIQMTAFKAFIDQAREQEYIRAKSG